jgi:predicted DNA-binding transcriptional regulator AlpA
MANLDIPKTHHLDKRADQLTQSVSAGSPDDLLDSQQVADLLGMSKSWVDIGRSTGYGPPFIEMGPRLVKYRRSDVIKWIRSRKAQTKTTRIKGKPPAKPATKLPLKPAARKPSLEAAE